MGCDLSTNYLVEVTDNIHVKCLTIYSTVIPPKVLFPTGVKVELERNYWGIDVTILTTRAESAEQESGVCLYDDTKDGDVNKFGLKERYCMNINQESHSFLILFHFRQF